MSNESIIRDPILASYGDYKIEWAKTHMPILNYLAMHYHESQPFDQTIITASVHVEAKTACFIQALAHLGAEVYVASCNPLSTQDDIAASLANTPNVTIYAIRDINSTERRALLCKALSPHPHLIVDHEGDLSNLLHNTLAPLTNHLIGGCEETAIGVRRLRALAENDRLKYSMIDIDSAKCKHHYDNHFGTGQSVLDSIMHSTNLIIAGKTVVVAGYGDCGSGIARRANGMGAKVVITEVDPIRAIKAHLDGYVVMSMRQAARVGDFFITATGSKDVITSEHIQYMKNGAILANAGHSDVEINLKTITAISDCRYEVRPNINCYMLPKGKRIYVLTNGYLVNLAATDGQASEIMDINYSIQLLSLLHLKKNFGNITKPDIYHVTRAIDNRVASLALKTNGLVIDTLSKDQLDYLENTL